MSEHNHLSISWSSLKSHEACKQQAYLARSGKRSPVMDHRVFFGGSVVDRVMRWWLENDAPPGAMPARVESIMDAEQQHMVEEGDGIVRWRHANDRSELLVWCVELVRRMEPLLQKHVLPYEFEVAKRFKVPVQIPYLDGRPVWINLIGEIDLLVRHPDMRFRVWDLKGTNDNSYWKKVLGQLLFYDVVVDAAFGAPCLLTGLIQPMCDVQDPTFNFTDDDRAVMWGRIARMASDVWQRDHTPKEGNGGCSWCAVKHACTKFTPVELGGTMSLVGGSSLDDVEVQSSAWTEPEGAVDG